MHQPGPQLRIPWFPTPRRKRRWTHACKPSCVKAPSWRRRIARYSGRLGRLQGFGPGQLLALWRSAASTQAPGPRPQAPVAAYGRALPSARVKARDTARVSRHVSRPVSRSLASRSVVLRPAHLQVCSDTAGAPAGRCSHGAHD